MSCYPLHLLSLFTSGRVSCFGGRLLPHAQVSLANALVNDVYSSLGSDVLSLVVALYAINVRDAKLAQGIGARADGKNLACYQLSSNSPTPKYSYGWHRAEILAALVNGVFLLALCLSIFLEAIERFFSVPGMD